MEKEEGFIKETITFYRPALSGRKYLNTQDYEFKGKDDTLIVEPKLAPKEKDN